MTKTYEELLKELPTEETKSVEKEEDTMETVMKQADDAIMEELEW